MDIFRKCCIVLFFTQKLSFDVLFTRAFAFLLLLYVYSHIISGGLQRLFFLHYIYLITIVTLDTINAILPNVMLFSLNKMRLGHDFIDL